MKIKTYFIVTFNDLQDVTHTKKYHVSTQKDLMRSLDRDYGYGRVYIIRLIQIREYSENLEEVFFDDTSDS